MALRMTVATSGVNGLLPICKHNCGSRERSQKGKKNSYIIIVYIHIHVLNALLGISNISSVSLLKR